MALQLKKQTLSNFIRMYETLPCLWDSRHVHYKNKKKRLEATNQLLQLVKQDDPEATRLLVVKKIDMLRCGVRRELAKVMKSRESITDPNDQYVPSLWYYKMFGFLYKEIRDHNARQAGGKNSILRKVLMSTDEDEDLAVHLQENEQDNDMNDEDIPYEEPEYFENSYDKVETKIECLEESESEEESHIEEANEYYTSSRSVVVEKSPRKRKESLEFEIPPPSSMKKLREIADEFDAIGINVAAKLRSLQPNTSILAEKLINDVLFQAQLNLLTPYSSLVHKDPI